MVTQIIKDYFNMSWFINSKETVSLNIFWVLRLVNGLLKLSRSGYVSRLDQALTLVQLKYFKEHLESPWLVKYNYFRIYSYLPLNRLLLTE